MTSDWVAWSRVSELRAAPGSTISVGRFGSRHILFAMDPTGAIYTTHRNAEDGWEQWSSVSGGGPAAPGSPFALHVSDFRSPDAPGQYRTQYTLFATDPNGWIFTTSGNPTDDWQPWTTVSDGRAAPGSPIHLVKPDEGRLKLLVTDPNGGIYLTSQRAQDDWQHWGEWLSVSDGRAAPGSPITLANTDDGRLILFVTDPNGGIYTNSQRDPDDWEHWQQWAPVSDGRVAPGSPITVANTPDWRHILFVTDIDGRIYETSQATQHDWEHWQAWTPVGNLRAAPGARVIALNHALWLILFVTDPNGWIYTTSKNAERDWADWSSVSGGRAGPGAPLTYVYTPYGPTLFVTDPDGGIYTTSQTAPFDWEHWGEWTTIRDGRVGPGSPITYAYDGTERGRDCLYVTDTDGIIYTSRRPWLG